MTAQEFRRMALRLEGATAQSHMGHPDFRVGGKIFATLGYPGRGWGMVKLTSEQQELFVRSQPKAFVPVKGAWADPARPTWPFRVHGKARCARR